ncbi:hypothetical protein GCN78_10310 [Janthinobacterium rivuli]|uniref:hypothetical protein n=1 Tax=Janthinobacterium sp. FT68W TaxID=2654255 RepID=UPI001264BC68|nr:hypothetical protein [Janthinobacterium sp. FT68W]KAB8052202.1 hypothetical protein GCN78_10310 [Janthinobacterium sp. FT68W]
MAQLGTVQTVVVCISGSSGTQGSCPSAQVQSVTQAYLIAPSESVRFDLMAEPFDVLQAGAFFGFSFASTMFVWLFALGIGRIINMVKTA